MKRVLILALAAALLAGCGGPELASEPTPAPTVAPTDAPTAAPTAQPTPTSDQAISQLKAQFADDAVVVREMKIDGGALPTLTVNFALNSTKMPAKPMPADISAEIERSMLTISKRTGAQLADGIALACQPGADVAGSGCRQYAH